MKTEKIFKTVEECKNLPKVFKDINKKHQGYYSIPFNNFNDCSECEYSLEVSEGKYKSADYCLLGGFRCDIWRTCNY